jgi:signal recognition particle receptor subunit beta
VVLGNKSDLPGALEPGEIAKKMELPEDTPVLATVATERQGLHDALRTLSEMIIGVR